MMLSNAFLIERELLRHRQAADGQPGARRWRRATCTAPPTTAGCCCRWPGSRCSSAGAGWWAGEDLFDDPRFADDDLRWENGDVLNDLMAAWCADKTKAEVLALLEAAKLPAAPLHSTQEVLDDPHVQAMGYLQRVPFPGAVRATCRSSRRRSGCRRRPGSIRRRAPLLGEHTDEILGEIGYTQRSKSRPAGPPRGVIRSDACRAVPRDRARRPCRSRPAGPRPRCPGASRPSAP